MSLTDLHRPSVAAPPLAPDADVLRHRLRSGEFSPAGAHHSRHRSSGTVVVLAAGAGVEAPAGAPVVHVRTGADRTTVLGPFPAAGPGCPRCYDLRRRLADPCSAEHDEAEQELLRGGPSSSALVDGLVADLVADLVDRTAQEAAAPHQRRVTVLHHGDLRVERHTFLPDPLCPACAGPCAGEEATTRIDLVPRPKRDVDTHRSRPAVHALERLRDLYVDDHCGLVHEVRRATQGGLAVAGVRMQLRRHGWTEPGFGRSRCYDESEATAVLEALERYGGVEPGEPRATVRGSWRSLSPRAVDPRSLGLHPEDTYAAPGSRYRRFEEDAPTDWVWAHSFAQDRPVLVPRSNAFYYVAHDTPERPFTYEVSNGCALGSCLEEAVLHGLLEAVERDAFLLTWHASLPAPRLDLGTAADPDVAVQARRLLLDTGYEVRLHDITVENGVPAVWASAVDVRAGRGADRPARVCAAGAHTTLEKAARSALSELGPFLRDFVGRWPEHASRAEAMVDDPSLVRTMEDHSVLYGSPRTQRRFAFLDGAPTATFQEAPGAQRPVRHLDLRDDVLDLVDRHLQRGQDVVVVDQTTPEHHAGDLRCVKVLVTGSLTMTFGHHLRRLDGVDRLLTVPAVLGHRDGPLTAADVRLDPHPFP